MQITNNAKHLYIYHTFPIIFHFVSTTWQLITGWCKVIFSSVYGSSVLSFYCVELSVIAFLFALQSVYKDNIIIAIRRQINYQSLRLYSNVNRFRVFIVYLDYFPDRCRY